MLNQDLTWLAAGYRPSEHLLSGQDSIPESEDKILISADDVQRMYPEQVPPQTSAPRRAQSARARYSIMTDGDNTYHHPSLPKRPISACPPSAGKGLPKRRASSAGTSRSVIGAPRQGVPREGYQYYIPTDPRSRLKIDFHPDPNHCFMDRHSRCFDNNHIHNPLLTHRPQPSCRSAWRPTGSRPGSSCSARAGYQGNMSTIQRYADHHRPQTAPGTRKELQILTKSNFLIRGLKPHFCNFVQVATLHERGGNERSPRYPGGGRDGGDGGGDYQPLVHSTDSISLGQWRRGSSASGIEGRPASPSSLGEDDKSGGVDSWPKDKYGSKLKAVISKTSDEMKCKEDKENDINTYVKIPPPLPPSQPKSAWREQTKVKKKSSALSKKGSKTGGTVGSQDAGGGNGDDGKGKKRSCIKKKEKKSVDRRRDLNQDMEPQVEPVTTIVEEKKTPEPEKEADSYQVDVKVPDLPTSSKADKEAEERAARARRNLIETEFLRSDLNEVLNQEMRDHHKEFEFDADSMSEDTLSKNSVRMSSWLTGRLALSQQSSRFTLPMDMKLLEKMSPDQYLRQYCVVSSRRHILYQKIFAKNRDKTGIILFKDIEKALKDVLVNTISHEEVLEVCELLEIDEETKLDYQLFCGIAAFAERILYPKFVTDDTADLADFQREKIECADFCALDWKFHGVNVNPPVKKMLKSLG